MQQAIRPPATDISAEVLQLLKEAESNLSLLSFARIYLQEMSAADMMQFSASQLAGCIHSLWANGQRRANGKPVICCYTPQNASHPWNGKGCVLDVIQTDMPFLVDSVTAIIHGMNLTVHLAMNPELCITRNSTGDLETLLECMGHGQNANEAWLQFFFDEITPEQQKAMILKVEKTLQDVTQAVEDWPMMRERAHDARDQLVRSHIVSNEDMQETQTFLTWLDNEHFTFLGTRDYKVSGTDSDELSLVANTGLGVLRDDSYMVFDGLREQHNQPPEVKKFIGEKKLLLVIKSSRVATVHRPVAMDAIFIKQFDSAGRIMGCRVLLGLFTSLAYSRNARDIPLIRQKVTRIMTRAGINPRSHDGKALTHILDTYPRDEIFQIDDDDLYNISTGVMQLQERKRVALFVRRDPFERFVSCLVYVPREAYATPTRMKIIRTLEASFNGTLKDFSLLLDQNPLARLHLIIATQSDRKESPDLVAVEAMIAAFCRSWQDRLREALIQSAGNTTGLELYKVYSDAFPAIYRDTISPEDVYDDVVVMEQVRETHRLGVKLSQRSGDRAFSLKLYHPDTGVMLSATLPMIENLGFKVESEYGPYEMSMPDGKTIWMHDYHVVTTAPVQYEFASIALLIEEALEHIWYGRVEDDRFNRLVLAAELPWRQATVLRMLAKYMRQIRVPFAPETIAETFAAHPQASFMLSQYFCTKFDPALTTGRTERMAELTAMLDDYIRDVPNMDDDHILRCAYNLLQAALRTNFYQTNSDGSSKPYISIKFCSSDIENLPLPKPYAEIFVYSPRVEAVHLRGGKIARGGIRWSDRREDFRTEVLGLMKAQMVKNTVIVPVGSKGGFIVKQPSTDFQAEGIACYQTFMRGLLDITDNIVNDEIIVPPQVVRYDNDDPYLVVAADKGTAKFSDIANNVSAEYDFWLGDAFASGGSAGYDHKHMAITARGAWEAVKRHFRELGIDTQTENFTCVGVGDMAGDVFGNGLLQSQHTKLLAAFNYAHIFIDPTPNAETAFAERQRLFNIGKGSWDQYDTKLISAGGGVWPRSQKSIPLSPEIQKALGVTANALSSNDLVKAILQAPADLLFFGGIGTYIKAPQESDADVGDKANDALRINANQVRVRVIGEGANLGMTQLGRVAVAQQGVKLNTDAIDNSAGVDTSDHEVNIKILLSAPMNTKSLTLETRNELLKGMTEEVAALVLRDNYLQTQALTLSEARSSELLATHKLLMQRLETDVNLNRTVEYLPTDDVLTERATKRMGLTRPELAVLLAYSKIWFYEKLLDDKDFTALAADPSVTADVEQYFPEPARHLYRDQIARHRLAHEIAATVMTNEILNRLGAAAVTSLLEKTDAITLTRAYIILRNSFDLSGLWQSIEMMDNKIGAKVQTVMMLAINRALEQGMQAVITNPVALSKPSEVVTEYSGALVDIRAWLASHPDAQVDNETLFAADARVPTEIRDNMQVISWLPLLPRLCHVMQQSNQSLSVVIPTFMAVDERLQLRRLHRHLSQQTTDNPWQSQALILLADDMLLVEERLTTNMIANGSDDFEAWLAGRHMNLTRFDELSRAVRASSAPDMALWTLVVRELVWLAGM